jgi:diguanylate cyclase (GGDEF)-like protein
VADENGPRSQDREPFSKTALFRTVGLLVGFSLMGLLYLAHPSSSAYTFRLIVQAATLTAVTVIATLFIPWSRLPASFRATPPLVFLVVAFLTREATGGAESTYAQLVLLPVVWLAVYGTAAELMAGLVGVAVALGAPLLMPGSSPGDGRHALLLVAVASGLGFLVQSFFAQLRAHTQRLNTMANTDHLTGASNRRFWDDALEAAVAEAAPNGRPLCVAVLDVDRFKSYNDRHGHLAGDRLLKELTAEWRGALRESDLLARLGGDEFAVLLTSCTLQSAGGIIDRLRAQTSLGWTVSAGVAQWDGSESPFDLVARADQALYRAKEAGRDRMRIALVQSPRRDARADEGARLESV